MHVSIKELSHLQENTPNIRNICIMAHVDHGKTSLADCLLMSNGIVSQSAIGERRYMDSRPDEQKRGITMKSSSILLKYTMNNNDYLINLIDSPGHIDFSSEVSCAVRLCDGVVIVVDVVEGICPQTQAVLYQAYIEKMEMILYINKVDRLINELEMTTLDAYYRMYNIVGQMNALLSSFYYKEKESNNSFKDVTAVDNDLNLSNYLLDNDIHQIFDPLKGNVLFGSSIDGWAFELKSFATILSNKLSFKPYQIIPHLWGDFFFDSKSKKFCKNAISNKKKPCFVQFVLDNIWHVYDVFKNYHENENKLSKIYNFIGVELKSAIKITDENSKLLVKEFMQNWLPAYKAVLEAVITHHPSPCSLSRQRIIKLMSNDNCPYNDLPTESKLLMQDFLKCSSNNNAPVIVYVSKMIIVGSNDSQFKIAKPVMPQIKNNDRNASSLHETLDISNENALEVDKVDSHDSSTTKLVAFARIFSGSLKSGSTLYVIMPKFQHKHSNSEINTTNKLSHQNGGYAIEITLEELYILMGNHMEPCTYVPSGNIVGIGGLDKIILKSATISSTLHCPTFSPMTFHVNPIVKVSIEPVSYKDLDRLSVALETLSLADSNLIYQLEDSGESVLYVTGEVHLQRCITDLESLFNLTNFNISNPIVPFKESTTIESCIGKDSTTQITAQCYYNNLPTFLLDHFSGFKIFEDDTNCPISSTRNVVFEDSDKKFMLKMRCISIPIEIQKWIEKVKNLDSIINDSIIDCEVSKLKIIIDTFSNKKLRREWMKIYNRIWFFGTSNAPINLLVDNIQQWKSSSIYFNQLKKNLMESENQISYLTSGLFGIIYSGFCMAINSGPLMEEPITDCCFIIEDIFVNDFDFKPEMLYSTNYDINISGRMMSIVKQCCRCSYLASGSVRLSLPMYETTIYLSSNVMGKAYAVLGRREAKIIREEILSETNLFSIVAQMPVIESFGFSAEILTKCRGLAQPQMSFSHWQILDVDPFWVPGTEEEIELHGKVEITPQVHNAAMKYIRSVRKRKGLSTDEKIVEYAEKQRTFKKNK